MDVTRKVWDLAVTEARDLRRLLESEDHLREAGVSVLLYAPVENDHEASKGSGLLIDVAPLPLGQEDLQAIVVGQAADSGESGAFFGGPEAGLTRTPLTEKITSATAEDYRQKNPSKAERTAQVRLEHARHGLTKKPGDAPPVGCFIHQLPLSPPMLDLECLQTRRLPILGLTYCISEKERPAGPRYDNLLDYSQWCARLVLRNRLRTLLGEDLFPTPVDHAHRLLNEAPFITEALTDDLVRTVSKLMLGHHWFFPDDPVAFELMARVTTEEEARTQFMGAGWIPPIHWSVSDRTPVRLLEHLEADIRQLLWYALDYLVGEGPRIGFQSTIPVRGAVRRAVLVFTGHPTYVKASTREILSEEAVEGRLWTRRFQQEALLALCPPSPLVATDGWESPAFPVASVRARVLRTGEMRSELMQGVAPGRTLFEAPRINLKPERCYSRFVVENRRVSVGKNSKVGGHEQARWYNALVVDRVGRPLRESHERKKK